MNSSQEKNEIKNFTLFSGGEHSKPHSKPANKPIGSGQQPHHPQVTSSADEFVWIDSYNRLGSFHLKFFEIGNLQQVFQKKETEISSLEQQSRYFQSKEVPSVVLACRHSPSFLRENQSEEDRSLVHPTLFKHVLESYFYSKVKFSNNKLYSTLKNCHASYCKLVWFYTSL